MGDMVSINYLKTQANILKKQLQDEIRKETAREILTRIKNIKHVGNLRSELDLLASKYGVEIEGGNKND